MIRQKTRKNVWLPLLGIGVLSLILCSGIASLLAGPEVGWHVAVTFGVLLLGFGVTSLISLVFLGVRRGERNPDDNRA